MAIWTALPVSYRKKKSLNVIIIVSQYWYDRRFLLNVPLPVVYRLLNAHTYFYTCKDGYLTKDDSEKRSFEIFHVTIIIILMKITTLDGTILHHM